MTVIETIVAAARDLHLFGRAECTYSFGQCHEFPMPLPVEEALSNALYSFTLLTPAQWKLLRAAIPEEITGSLYVYAIRMASFAVKQNEYRVIENGLLALLLDDHPSDPRDILTPLCLLCDAARRIEMFYARSMVALARLATAKRRKIIDAIIERPAEDVTPEDMGYRAVGLGPSFLYVGDR